MNPIFFIISFIAISCSQLSNDSTALYDFYQSTNGQQWTIQWAEENIFNDTCNLYGIKCNNNDRVSSIDLAMNNLTGFIPDSIGNITYLTHINLSSSALMYSNYLNGSMPETICNLMQLIYLDISFVLLSGSIPECITNLRDLSHISLSGNQLTGTLPSSISNLIHLTTLNISYNQYLTGCIPDEIILCKQLKIINLGGNNLTGTIPNIGNLPMLSTFNIGSDNALFGNINITSLPLGNNIQGTIPDISYLTELKIFDITNNSISGTIPDLKSNTKLKFFVAAGNMLTGSLPALPELTLLFVENNLLTGTLQNEIFNIAQVNLRNNQLFGTIPENHIGVWNTSIFMIGNNMLSGSIPASICGLGSQTFDISNNQFSGNIPGDFFDIPRTTIYLNNNALSGSIHAITNTHLLALYLSNNKLSGTFPILPHAVELINLLLDNNNFEGDLNYIFSNITIHTGSVTGMALDIVTLHNNFYAKNVDEFLNLLLRTGLTKLTLFGNPMYGKTNHLNSDCITHLCLHSINLFGSLPQMNLPALKYITAFDNRLSCEMPNFQSPNITSSLVLSSNLFSCPSSSDMPNWMRDSSPFSQVESLYITNNDVILDWFLVVYCSIVTILWTFRIVFIKIKRKRDCNLNSYHTFWSNVGKLEQIISHWSLAMIVLALFVIHYVNSTYFECILPLQTLSFAYFNGNNVYQWVLIFLYVILNILWFLMVFHVNKAMHMNCTHSTSRLINSDRDKPLALSKQEVLFQQNNNHYIQTTFKWLFYLIMYLLGTLLLFIYILGQSLPEDNILGLQLWQIEMISKAMSTILVIQTAIIIPHFIDLSYKTIYKTDVLSSTFISKYRSLIIVAFRTVTSII
eukprot:438571_1